MTYVTPAEAGAQITWKMEAVVNVNGQWQRGGWVPAFAGMTCDGAGRMLFGVRLEKRVS